MRFTPALNVLALASFLTSVKADIGDEPSVSTDTFESPTDVVEIEHPPVEILSIPPEAVLFEQFQGDTSRWKSSNAKKNDEFSYVGKWSIEEATVTPGLTGDKGLVVKSPAAHHAISAKFDKPLDNTGKTLVVQYEVKLQETLECGGAYLKLLTENGALHEEEFSGETPYQVMFGPDKCGSTNKVHFIVRRKDPKTEEYEEKHLVLPPPARLNRLSNLYTLIVKPDQDFEIRINGDVVKAGNMLDEGVFSPGFNPAKEIEDPDDTKPDDWVEEKLIPDPEQAEKPDDWDEDAPLYIPDPEVTMPEDWDETLEVSIPDPDAEKPEDWDDEEDGEWIAPLIDNPACEVISGCGPWTAPKIRNPDYKGPWVQPKIDNPDYKGPWSPRLIPNPDYYEDATPSNLEPIGGVGFELWTMQPDMLFDNIYIGHSIEEAENIGNKTFIVKHTIELEEEKAALPPPTEKARKNYSSALDFFFEDPRQFLLETTRNFILSFNIDPYSAIVGQPYVALAFAATFTVFFAGVFGILGVISSVLLNKASKDAEKAKKEKKEKEESEPAEPAENNEDSATTSGAGSSTRATRRKN